MPDRTEQLTALQQRLDAQARAIEAEAKRGSTTPYELRDANGGYPYAPVLVAQAQVEAALNAAPPSISAAPHCASVSELSDPCAKPAGHDGKHVATRAYEWEGR